MSFAVLAVSFLLAAANASFPVELQRRATSCNRDDCFRSIFNTKNAAKASLDCSSILAKTVAQCTVTVTSTATTSVPIATSTLVLSTQITSLVTSYTPSPVVVVTSLVTVAAAKRNVLAEGIAKRAVTTCSTTIAPSIVPSYATSICPGTRFSSACACNGISIPTVTPSAAVSTVTVTVTTQVSYIAIETSILTTIVTVPTTIATPTTSTLVQTTTLAAAPSFGSDCPSVAGFANPYVAANNKQFQVLCNSLYYQNINLGVFQRINFRACLDLCSVTTGCNFIDYSRPPYESCELLTVQFGYYADHGLAFADSAALLPPFEPYTVLPDPEDGA